MSNSQEASAVLVIGAGMAGLSASIRLAAAGYRVIVCEGQNGPGGKMRRVEVAGQAFDAGPTVLTMKWVFEALFSAAGRRLDDELTLIPSSVIARHYWRGGACLDLHADQMETIRAICDFAGRREADGYRRFAADSRRVYEVLKDSFIDAPRPNPVSLSRRIGLGRPGDLFAIKPFSTLWSALGGYFADIRLRQLFARYATYCGSSPYLSPATLMLVAHVEQEGVWTVQGGVRALAARLEQVAVSLGVEFCYGDAVTEIVADPSRRAVAAVVTRSGRRIPARQIVYNGDVAALPRLLGLSQGGPRSEGQHSLSALVSCRLAEPSGAPLAHHTVFFSDDYQREFEAIFSQGRPPADPTVYLCAQDRNAAGQPTQQHSGPERIYTLMNLPANGDRHRLDESEVSACLNSMDMRLAMNGLTLSNQTEPPNITTPDRFADLYPATGGALYGMASHGWMASFARPGSLGPLRGLYLAGGSVHPGPGLPMAAISGRLAAERVMADRPLIRRSRPAAITGGMSTERAIVGVSPSP
ncbi:1-hydroxycarotenoid 3,4-desaturase CrtD [Peteryoungia ipomoeae]|uniref:Phytoene desaturase n=1 Tax=Peteryoungia ipomoeae TaxID=1210932 RepID=A0A4V4HMX1_9HYPH|nr:1-hydroxycarotenoid 3,4-desaturase CrtD [Peteryoungia ipomoeae]THV23776.1 phytoene desaturase [Peteryoungia ipomoeae]